MDIQYLTKEAELKTRTPTAQEKARVSWEVFEKK